MAFDHRVGSLEALRALYREPSKTSLAKEVDRLDDHCRSLIALSPIVAVATTDVEGHCDVSPRGGPSGFVRVLDDHRLAWGDLSGNNRLDTLQNIVESRGIALLFLVPGLEETLRVNGRACVTTDPSVLDACALDALRPRVAVGVDVETAYIHCAKALRRAGVWEPGEWPDTSHLPSVACMLRDHYGLPDMDVAAVEKRLAISYRDTIWQPGGQPAA
jgi:uncharacterized protein